MVTVRNIQMLLIYHLYSLQDLTAVDNIAHISASAASDPVHGLKYILTLDVYVKHTLRALLLKKMRQPIKRRGAVRQIDQHYHGEEFLHERLADVEDIDLLLRKQGRHIGRYPLWSPLQNTLTIAFIARSPFV